MAYRFTPGDVAFLCSVVGQDALAAAEQLPLTPDSRLLDVDALRALTGARAGAVLETAAGRDVHDLACSIGAGDAIAAVTPAGTGATRGSGADPGSRRRSR